MKRLIRQLKEAGSEGSDLSPGDPLCAEAAVAIERLCEHVVDLETALNSIIPNEKLKKESNI